MRDASYDDRIKIDFESYVVTFVTNPFWLSLVIICAFSGWRSATSLAQDPELQVSIMSLSIEDGVMKGDGAEILRADLKDAQFILVGEEHGFADAPMIARAIALEARPFGMKYLAVELGPFSTEWASHLIASQGVDALAAALVGRPLAIPFLSMREDAELAKYFVTGEDGAETRLWGIDQEFIGSTLIHLEKLAQQAADEEFRTMVNGLLDIERKAFGSGNQTQMFMFTSKPEIFDKLRSGFPDDSDSFSLIGAVQESAVVYQLYPKKNYRSNSERTKLIRKYFLDAYHNSSEEKPRVLFKMGNNHVALGTTTINTIDIGSVLEGISAVNGLTTLRIAFLPLAGRQTKIQPSPDGFYSEVDYHSKLVTELLAKIGVQEKQIKTDVLSLISLEELRAKLGQPGLDSLSRQARMIALGFDYLITTADAKPATPLSLK